MANVQDVARFFIDMAQAQEKNKKGDGITQLRLQKMLYFAQGWSLAREGKPLFEAEIEAWKYGPVVPEVYRTYSSFGPMTLREMNPVDRNRFKDSEYALLLDVAQKYAGDSTYKLVEMTHENGGPWSGRARSEIIPKDEIKKYFETHGTLEKYDALIAEKTPVIEAGVAEDGAAILPAEMDDGEEWDEYDTTDCVGGLAGERQI